MGSFVYDALCTLFGGGLVDEMSDWMNSLFLSVRSMTVGKSTGLVATSMDIFAAIACSMLILYFFMDLVNQASRDMFSFEKLIVSFIRFLAAFVVLLCLKDLLTYFVRIGQLLYMSLSDSTIKDKIITSTGQSLELFPSISRNDLTTMPEWNATTMDAFDNAFKGIGAFIKNFQVLIICVIASLIGLVAKLAGYFVCTSNAVMIIARIVFAPIAVVQLFEDGTRSAGMRYLKGLMADLITMAVIIVILYAASALTSSMVVNKIGVDYVDFDNLSTVISVKNIAIALVPELVAVGGMAGGSKIAHDVMGA